MLAQSAPPDEVIIVDDASTDDSPQVIAGYAARYPERVRPILLTENCGPNAARNHVLAAATSDLLAFLDGDDRWRPEKLARALARLEASPMPTHVRRMRPMYHGIGIAAPITIQVAFANVWLFGPLLKRWLTRNPEMNASIRTTTALTIVRGGVEDNTVPAEAKAIVNFRLLPGDTIADVLWHAKKVIDDERVHIKPVEGKFNEALPISPSKGPAYDSLKLVIRQVFDNPPVAPFVMLGGTDCQHFVPVCDDIYRFTSLVMDESFRGLEHGIDERIPVDGMAKMVTFYAQLMRAWDAKEMTFAERSVS